MIELSILVLFNFFFFYTLYTKPFIMATSELLSTFFPTWISQGRSWRKGVIPRHDTYWLNSHSHPVLSTYYPPAILSSLIGSFASLNKAFCVLLWSLGLHILFGSIGWYMLLRGYFNEGLAVLGAITFTYQAFHMRQQPCIVYTIAWFPWIGICAPLAIGMILLAGYYPLAIYLLPMGLLLNHNPLSWLLGLALGLPQILPFVRYLPKTIRTTTHAQVATPSWEKKWYFGVIPLLLVTYTHLLLLLIVVSIILFRHNLPRVPWRAGIIVSYGFIWLSLCHLESLNLGQNALMALLIIHCLDLYLHNSNLMPTRPFCELYQKPSRAFKSNKLVKYLDSHLGDFRVSGLPFPLFTGLINNFKTLGYCGGMQLKLMAKFRNDTNPNGSGHHDWFKSNGDDTRLDDYRVKFAYSRSKLNWIKTEVKHLWRNPRIS